MLRRANIGRVLGTAIWRLPVLRAMANLVVLLAVYGLYRVISLSAPRNPVPAHAHAAALIRLERQLHILAEPQVQHYALQHGLFNGIVDGSLLRKATILVYAGGHMPWLAATLLWLYLFRREHFGRVRNVAIMSTLLAIDLAALYPVASPHFTLAGRPYGIEYVTGSSLPEAVIVRLANYDPYAALPSIHTLWALLTGLGLFLGANHRRSGFLAACFPATMVAVVVISGNHYFLDCVASTTLLACCLVLQRIWERARLHAAPSVHSPVIATERRRSPNLRPLDQPLLLCSVASIVLCVSADPLQRLFGVLQLGCGVLFLMYARRHTSMGRPLFERSPSADWWCGLLFVLGATMIGTNDHTLRMLASGLWLIACGLPLYARTVGSASGRTAGVDRGARVPLPAQIG